MSSLWNKQDVALTGSKWERSYRQEFFTELGKDFTLIAWMEEVLATGNEATAQHTPLGTFMLTASSITADPVLGPLAFNVQSALTALVGTAWEIEKVRREGQLAREEAARLAALQPPVVPIVTTPPDLTEIVVPPTDQAP